MLYDPITVVLSTACSNVEHRELGGLDFAPCRSQDCQRRSGAAASANAHPAPGTFRIVAGEDKLRVWKPTTVRDELGAVGVNLRQNNGSKAARTFSTFTFTSCHATTTTRSCPAAFGGASLGATDWRRARTPARRVRDQARRRLAEELRTTWGVARCYVAVAGVVRVFRGGR